MAAVPGTSMNARTVKLEPPTAKRRTVMIMMMMMMCNGLMCTIDTFTAFHNIYCFFFRREFYVFMTMFKNMHLCVLL